MRKQADALKVCPMPDACLLFMAQRPSRLLGLPKNQIANFSLIKNSPDQVEGLPTTHESCILINEKPVWTVRFPKAPAGVVQDFEVRQPEMK
jgi:hypothetical protein